MHIGQVFRYSRPYDAANELIDGLPNYFYYTQSPNSKLPLLESGINPIQKIQSTSRSRRPAILISSSPHKIGMPETPWQDVFDPDNGHVRFYGDNKQPGSDPSESPGNRVLLEQFSLHSSPNKSDRLAACPILVFRRVKVGSRAKGNVQFQGFGIVNRAERVTQFNRREDKPFTNYVFDFAIFDLKEEDGGFDWGWITKRRDPSVSEVEAFKASPKTWQTWASKGHSTVESCRMRVVKLLTTPTNAQLPPKGSREEKALNVIYDYYSDRKVRFEALAAFIATKVLENSGSSYRNGWITSAGSDGGADFIARLDVGSGLASAKLIVLGQAKCEKLTTPTNGNHIARTVARLRRGWIGVYVTTSYFSESVQREVLEDKYPIVLINGKRIASEVCTEMDKSGESSVVEFLNTINETYDQQVSVRQPEEILYD